MVDIGPGAGEHGGWVVVSGPVKELIDNERSLTGAYLSGRASIPMPHSRLRASANVPKLRASACSPRSTSTAT